MTLFRKKYNSASDDELLLMFRDGEVNPVLEQFYIRYAHLILGTAIKYCKNIEDAEDIVMQVFLQLPHKIEKHSIQNFKAWLHMVTKNECLMQLRKKNHIIPRELENINVISEEPEYDTLTDEQIELVLNSLQELKEPQRSCVQLFYIDKRSYAEISELLSLEINTVKSAIQNGKRNIKLKLEDRNEFQ
jgi:RNA polymerase sigma-70 factor (ECF subfamily)